MQNIHFRGVDAEDAIAAIEERLEREGFELLDGEDAPPEDQPGLRRIAIYEEDEWVGVADDPFAQTNWGEVLSYALEVPVVTLAGECDHVFYSHVFVHENGAEKHASKVPEDLTHGADGRYRISPTFLESYFPNAKVDGLVVHDLGGEENMRVVGAAVGIPKPLFSIYADEDDAYAILTFRFSGSAESSPDLGVFESELGGDMNALIQQMTGQLMENMMGEVPGLHATPSASKESGFLGQALNLHCSFALGGREKAKGLTVTLSGSALDLFDPPEMTAEKFDETTLRAKSEVAGDERIYRFPDLELSPKEPSDTEALPPAEQLRRSMQRLRSTEVFRNPAEVVIRIEGMPTKIGEGDYHFEAVLENGEGAASDSVLTIEPALELPLLPGAPALSAHHAQSYAGRDFAVGWIAFDALTPLLRALATELVTLLDKPFGVDVTRKGGERLHFDVVDWAKLAPELERGADISVSAGDLFRGTRVEIVHQPEGPNLFAGQMPAQDRRPPKATLTWSVPRPKDPLPLATWAHHALTRAGAEASVIGGVASAQGESGTTDLPYENLAQTRLAAYDVRWLAAHVRSPGWRVLAPTSAPLTPSEGVAVVELGHARLLASAAPTPFDYSRADATAMERAVLKAVGEPEA